MQNWRRVICASVVRLVAGLVMTVAVGGVVAGPVQAEVRPVPNSIVTLDLGAGFTPATRYSGFENAELGASFVVVELPAEAYASIESGMSREALGKRGMVLVERRKLKRADPHVFVHARQNAAGQVYEKMFVIFQDGGKTILVSANIPQTIVESGQLPLKAVEAVLTSAAVGSAAAPRFRYQLTDIGRFKPAESLMGMDQTFTLSGRLAPAPDGTRERSVLLVSPTIDTRDLGDLPAMSRRSLIQMRGLRDVVFQTANPVTVSGLRGFEVTAEAVELDDGSQTYLYQMILMDPDGGYFKILGYTDQKVVVSELKAMAHSFQLKP